MIGFVAVKSLGGYNYVRPDQVIAVAGVEGAKCNIYHGRRHHRALL